MQGTGKTEEGKPTLERTGAHEFGHSAGIHRNNGAYRGHPQKGTEDGNLMHQAIQPNAGKKLNPTQILDIWKRRNKLNRGNTRNMEEMERKSKEYY